MHHSVTRQEQLAVQPVARLDRQTDRQTDRHQTDIHTSDRQTYIHTYIRQTDRHKQAGLADRHTYLDGQTDRYTLKHTATST